MWCIVLCRPHFISSQSRITNYYFNIIRLRISLLICSLKCVAIGLYWAWTSEVHRQSLVLGMLMDKYIDYKLYLWEPWRALVWVPNYILGVSYQCRTELSLNIKYCIVTSKFVTQSDKKGLIARQILTIISRFEIL